MHGQQHIKKKNSLLVSSNVVLIIRRSNCSNTASGIVTLCRWPSGMQVEQFILNILLAVHPNITLVNDQIDAQFFLFYNMFITVLSTCFEQRCAHHQEVKF
jgi:hypothetical protein